MSEAQALKERDVLKQALIDISENITAGFDMRQRAEKALLEIDPEYDAQLFKDGFKYQE